MRQYGEPRRHHDAEGHRNEQSWPSPHDAQQQGRAVNLAVFDLHRPVVSRPLDTAIDRPSPDVIKAYASLSPNELCDVLELSCVIEGVRGFYHGRVRGASAIPARPSMLARLRRCYNLGGRSAKPSRGAQQGPMIFRP